MTSPGPMQVARRGGPSLQKEGVADCHFPMSLWSKVIGTVEGTFLLSTRLLEKPLPSPAKSGRRGSAAPAAGGRGKRRGIPRSSSDCGHVEVRALHGRARPKDATPQNSPRPRDAAATRRRSCREKGSLSFDASTEAGGERHASPLRGATRAKAHGPLPKVLARRADAASDASPQSPSPPAGTSPRSSGVGSSEGENIFAASWSPDGEPRSSSKARPVEGADVADAACAESRVEVKALTCAIPQQSRLPGFKSAASESGVKVQGGKHGSPSPAASSPRPSARKSQVPRPCSLQSRSFSASEKKLDARSLLAEWVGGKHSPRQLERILEAVVAAPLRPDLAAHYCLGRTLGEGGFGVVKECTKKASGACFACKVVRKDSFTRPKDLLRAKMEAAVQQVLGQHKNVVQVEEVFEDAKKLYIVMERCPSGDMLDFLHEAPSLSEGQAGHVFVQVLHAVNACHQNRVVHRDLKLENILINSPAPSQPGRKRSVDFSRDRCSSLHVKLADFGSAALLPEGQMASWRTGGSPMYQAPEVLSGQPHDFKADMWSLGVILFALLSKYFPFTAPTDSLMPSMIKRGVFSFASPVWGGVSESAKDLIRLLLRKEPWDRPSAAEVFSHPWVVHHCAQGSQMSLELQRSKSLA